MGRLGRVSGSGFWVPDYGFWVGDARARRASATTTAAATTTTTTTTTAAPRPCSCPSVVAYSHAILTTPPAPFYDSFFPFLSPSPSPPRPIHYVLFELFIRPARAPPCLAAPATYVRRACAGGRRGASFPRSSLHAWRPSVLTDPCSVPSSPSLPSLTLCPSPGLPP
ncbi:hypothetical protein BD413DRAFT_276519 [Trametes elegans]|nr:hypothetical protein BD413DRAFT_276519 [Trametes elegans]